MSQETSDRRRPSRLTDLLGHQASRRAESRDLLRALAQEAQADGTYDLPADAYGAALAEARAALARRL